MLFISPDTYVLSHGALFKKIYNSKSDMGFIVKIGDNTYKLIGSNAKIFQMIASPFRYRYSIYELTTMLQLTRNEVVYLMFELLANGVVVKRQEAYYHCPLFLNKSTFIVKANHRWVIGNFKTCSVDYIGEEVAMSLLENRIDDIPNNILEELYTRNHITNGYALMTTDDYSTTVENYLVLTYRCNLTCSYCFEKHAKHDCDNMGIDVLNSILKNLNEITENQTIVLYGGEPLLSSSKKIINRIIDFVSMKDNFAMRIITNGVNISKYLPLFQRVKKKISSFTITIDGNQSIHDSRRIFHSGAGTYVRVVRSLKALVANDYTCIIRINLDENNYNKISDLIKELHQINKKNLLHVFLARVDNPTDPKFHPLSIKKEIEAYNTIREISNISIISDIPILQFMIQYNKTVENELLFFGQRSNYCSNERINVFDTNGRIYCCNEAMGDSYFEKNLMGSRLAVSNITPFTFWKCNNCSVFPLCLGNCPRTNRYIANCANRCEQANIEEALITLCSQLTNIGIIGQ